MTVRPSPTQLRERFRAQLAADDLLVIPGGFSPLYAAMAERVGFEAFFLAGSQLSWFLYGVPDNGVMSLRDVVDHARHLVARTSIPILVDADTGYGNAVNVHYSVQEFARCGVAGISLEDQEAPKKSGTLAGRRCIPTAEAVGKIRAAVAARDEIDPAFVICARTDAIGSEGMSFDDALERGIAYASDGGADLVWLNSVQSAKQLRAACAAIPAPVVTIWGGPEPRPTFDELSGLGASAILAPTVTSTAGAQAAWEVLHELRENGEAGCHAWFERAASTPSGRAPTVDLVGTSEVRRVEETFLPDAGQRDYGVTFGHRPSEG